MTETIRQKLRNQPHLPIYDDEKVSIHDFIRLRCSEYFTNIEDRIWIYLDINHWIGMRDALRHNQKNSYFDLYESLRKSVKQKQTICLISDVIFFELLNQVDDESRLLTSELIAELSESYTISCLYEIEPILVRNSLAEIFQANDLIIPEKEFLINKAPNILGVQVPTPENDALKPHTNQIRKSFFDALNQLSLFDMMTFIKSGGGPIKPEMAQTSAYLNSKKDIHDHLQGDFKKVYLAECRGIVDALVNAADETVLLRDLLNRFPLNTNMMKNALFYCIEQSRKEIKHIAPGLIAARLHASTHHDKRMKYNSSHLSDFRHCSYAAPYCDYFFTDGPFHRRLTTPPLSLEAEHQIQIESSPPEIVKLLAAL